MIRIYRRPANAEDMKAMTQGKGSLVRNILTVPCLSAPFYLWACIGWPAPPW